MVARKVFLFCSVFSLMLAGTSFAKAEDDVENNEGLLSSIEQPAVLFKIHDVKPLRDRDGNVTDCEFGVTFYNRTNSDVNKIAMDLTWTDEVVGNVIQMEKNADMLKKQRENYNNNQGIFSTPQSETEALTPVSLTASLKVPDLQPYRQISLKSKIKTDRCFLMLNQPVFKFSSCNVKNSSAGGVSVQAPGMTACDDLVKYVSAQDPEYYREFKKVSFNEEKKAKVAAQKKQQDELTEIYDQVVSDLSRANDILGQIH